MKNIDVLVELQRIRSRAKDGLVPLFALLKTVDHQKILEGIAQNDARWACILAFDLAVKIPAGSNAERLGKAEDMARHYLGISGIDPDEEFVMEGVTHRRPSVTRAGNPWT